MFKYLKLLILLKVYRLLFDNPVLVCKQNCYYIGHKSVWNLKLTRTHIRFIGSWYGVEKIYSIRNSDILTITKS